MLHPEAIYAYLTKPRRHDSEENLLLGHGDETHIMGVDIEHSD